MTNTIEDYAAENQQLRLKIEKLNELNLQAFDRLMHVERELRWYQDAEKVKAIERIV